jgi:drug/metabolite transporter (DMT)-like permease
VPLKLQRKKLSQARRLFPGVPPLTVTAGMLAAGPLLVAAAVTEPAPQVTARVLLVVTGLGTACTAGGFTALFALIKRRSPLHEPPVSSSRTEHTAGQVA